MPSSPFGKPLDYEFKPSFVLPGTKHVFNGETVSGETAAQATQMDHLVARFELGGMASATRVEPVVPERAAEAAVLAFRR